MKVKQNNEKPRSRSILRITRNFHDLVGNKLAFNAKRRSPTSSNRLIRVVVGNPQTNKNVSA